MAHPRSGRDTTTDWVDLEEKVVDNVKPVQKGRTRTIIIPKAGKKGKPLRLTIPVALKPEVKRWFEVAFWNDDLVASPAGTPLIYTIMQKIVSGTGPTQRIGNVIKVLKVVLRLHIYQVTTLTFTTVNIAVVKDTEPVGGQPGWTAVFQTIGGAGTGAYNTAIPAQDTRFRYQYLKEAKVPLEWTAAYWNGSAAVISTKPHCMTLEIPINQYTEYISTTGSPGKGFEIHLMAWSDTNSNIPKINGSYEIFYTDV